MSDIGASSPAVDTSAPPAPPPEVDVAAQPEPLKTHNEPKPVEAKKPVSTREALLAAQEKQKAKETAEAKPVKTEAKVDPKAAKPVETAEQKATRERGEHGHFKSKDDSAEPVKDGEQAPVTKTAKTRAPEEVEANRAPPKRWSSPEGRAAWDAIAGDEHEHLRHEVHRTIRELEGGLEKHRGKAQRFDTVYAKYDDLARQSNVDPDKVLSEYVRLDTLINNPKTLVSGIEQILNGRGITLQQFAQHVTGQKASDGSTRPAGKNENEVRLEAELAQIKRRLDSGDERQQKAQVEQTTAQVADWLASKPHGERLAFQIAEHIKEGLSPNDAYDKALEEAQELARELTGDGGSSPSPKPAIEQRSEPDAEHIARGQKSIAGAPSSGSSPAKKQPSSSIRESLKRVIQAQI